MTTRIQLRRGTLAAWTTANPTLAAGEVGVELDTGMLKVGDGSTAWASLPYFEGDTTALTSSLPVNVKAHAATGDGVTDDTAAIQAALTAAATSGQATFIPSGTYLVSLPAGLDYMLRVAAGQVVYGDGPKSVVKVKSGAGDYRAVFTGATVPTDLSGLVIRDLTVDQNNTGNALTVTTPLFAGFPRYAIYAAVGDAITVRNCTFRDIDAVNTVAITGQAVTDARIQDCRFKQVGTSVGVHDYSAIYTSSAGSTITGNVFEGVSAGGGATTAIETHGSAQVVTGNRIKNFSKGMNVTGVTNAGNDSVIVTGNVISGVLIGIDLWSYAGTNGGLRNCVVAHNTITLDRDPWLRTAVDYPRGIMLDPSATDHYDNLRIEGNTIVLGAFTAAGITGELAAAGISLALSSTAIELRNVAVVGNTVVGSLSSGLRLAATVVRGRIGRNVFIDPGQSTDAGLATFYRSGLTLVGTHTDLRVDDNRTFDTRAPHTLVQGIMTSLTAVTRCEQYGNTVVCTDGAALPVFVPTAGKPFAGRPESPVATSFTSGLYYGPQGGRSTVTTTDGTLSAAPFYVSVARTFDRVGCEVTTAGAASSVLRLGVYADGGGGTPSALVLDAGTVPADSTGAKEITIALSLPAGLYWLAAAPQGGAPVVRSVATTNITPTGVSTLAVATGATPRSGYTMAGVAGALPATYVQAGQTAGPTLVVLRSGAS